jgi:cell wall-associated NlpC family hydrolase
MADSSMPAPILSLARRGSPALAAMMLAAGLSTGCATTGAVPRPFPGASVPAADPARSAALVDTAMALRGVPYRSGGADPSGFDCSGFTQYVFARHGLTLPREVRDQFRVGRAVDRREVQRGDLLFFATTSSGPSHVALALDRRTFVHAPSSTGVVRVERLDVRYWADRFLGARRPL